MLGPRDGFPQRSLGQTGCLGNFLHRGITELGEDSTQHVTQYNPASAGWALPGVGSPQLKEPPSRGSVRLGWSRDEGFSQGEGKPRASRVGNSGTTRTKAFLWAHSFNLQQEAIRKNN